jgi:hypothetical protein
MYICMTIVIPEYSVMSDKADPMDSLGFCYIALPRVTRIYVPRLKVLRLGPDLNEYEAQIHSTDKYI